MYIRFSEPAFYHFVISEVGFKVEISFYRLIRNYSDIWKFSCGPGCSYFNDFTRKNSSFKTNRTRGSYSELGGGQGLKTCGKRLAPAWSRDFGPECRRSPTVVVCSISPSSDYLPTCTSVVWWIAAPWWTSSLHAFGFRRVPWGPCGVLDYCRIDRRTTLHSSLRACWWY